MGILCLITTKWLGATKWLSTTNLGFYYTAAIILRSVYEIR